MHFAKSDFHSVKEISKKKLRVENRNIKSKKGLFSFTGGSGKINLTFTEDFPLLVFYVYLGS